MITFFWASIFIKRPYNILLLTFIMFKHVKVAKYIEKCNKNIVKFHPGTKCWQVLASIFSFFHPGIKFHPCPFEMIKFHSGKSV